MPRTTGALAALALTASLAVVPTAAGAGKTVRVGDDFFSAKTVRISKGSTVTWRWVGDDRHNVAGKGFRSPTRSSGTYRKRFAKRGTYRYVCTLHADKMRGTVVVR